MSKFKLIICDVEERELHNIEGTYSLKILVEKFGLTVKPRDVFINGVKKRLWKRYVPVDNDTITFFMTAPGFESIAETVGSALGSVFSFAGSYIPFFMAVGVALGLLSNLLGGKSSDSVASPVTSTSSDNDAGSTALALAGVDMSASPSQKVPLTFGSFAYRPDLITNTYYTCGNYTATLANNMSVCVGYKDALDTVSLSDMRVVDENAVNIAGVAVTTGTYYVIPKHPNLTVTPMETDEAATFLNSISSIDDGSNTSSVRVMTYFPSGIYQMTNEGALQAAQVNIFATLHYNNGSQTSIVWCVYAASKNAFYYEYTIPGSSTARKLVINYVKYSDSNTYTHVGTTVIQQVAFYQNKAVFNNSNLYTFGIYYPNTISLDSSSMKVLANLRCKYRNAKTLEIETTTANNGNPADAILYAATSRNSLGSRAYADAAVDLEALAEFRDYCEARNYKFNLPVADGRSLHALLLHIALIGHARIVYNAYGKLSLLIDDFYDESFETQEAPVVCILNSANTIKDSWQVIKSNIDYSQKYTVLRINFMDGNTNSISVSYIFLDARRYYNGDGSLKSFSEVVASIDYSTDVITTIDMSTYEGITNPDMVYEMGRREILKRWYTTQQVVFNMAVQHNGLAVWDRVWLNHRLLSNSTIGGQILTLTGDVIKLDRPIQAQLDNTLDDALARRTDLISTSLIINHIDTEGNASFSNTYTIVEIIDDFSVRIIIPDGDPLLSVTLSKYDMYSVASSYSDMLIVNKKPSDNGLFSELTCIDYLYDESCRTYVNDPVAMYTNAVKLKYGNPYMTYLETVPNHYTNGKIE